MTGPRPRVPPIEQWRDLANDFAGSPLLLGNGFSIRLWGAFRYDSLFREFLNGCNAADRGAFSALGNTNFEFILESLATSVSVNAAFGLETARLEKAQATIRDGLVQSIHATHPTAAQLDRTPLRQLSEQLDEFGDIYTLNYDVLLYHVIMITKDRHEANRAVRPYNDYFWSVLDDERLVFQNFQLYKKYKHVFYLHGALFLFRHEHLDVKIRRIEPFELIERIGQEIRNGQVPLFISEGTASEKLLAITRSDYLRFANERFAENRETLVIYGTSLSDPDSHVAAAIRKGTRRVAFGVHVAGKDAQTLADLQLEVMRKLGAADVRFFDSDDLFG